MRNHIFKILIRNQLADLITEFQHLLEQQRLVSVLMLGKFLIHFLAPTRSFRTLEDWFSLDVTYDAHEYIFHVYHVKFFQLVVDLVYLFNFGSIRIQVKSKVLLDFEYFRNENETQNLGADFFFDGLGALVFEFAQLFVHNSDHDEKLLRKPDARKLVLNLFIIDSRQEVFGRIFNCLRVFRITTAPSFFFGILELLFDEFELCLKLLLQTELLACFLQNLIIQKFFNDLLDNVDYGLRLLCDVTSCGSFLIVTVVLDCLVIDIESIIFTRTTN